MNQIASAPRFDDIGMKRLLQRHGQLWLDIGCGDAPQPNCVTMDKRPLPHVDAAHEIEDVPWPFPSDTFQKIIASHVIEHLKPWTLIDVMNEAWRVMKIGGDFLIAMPYAGSFGFWQDPTHTKAWNEATVAYFDPFYKDQHKNDGGLYAVYKPKPWRVLLNTWHSDGNMEIVLVKRAITDVP